MSSPSIIKVALPVPLARLFDYRPPKGPNGFATITPGTRVLVPFGRRKLTGVVVALADQSGIDSGKLKTIIEILDPEPVLPEHLMQLLAWASSYYHHPIGEVIEAAMPATLRKGQPACMTQIETWLVSEQGKQVDAAELKRAPVQLKIFNYIDQAGSPVSAEQLVDLSTGWRAATKALVEKGWLDLKQETVFATGTADTTSAPVLNAEQIDAIEQLRNASGFKAFVLDGITGSGKTEVYLGAMQKTLQQGQQVLMLVPEIGLTPQLIERVRGRVSVPVLALHSGLTDTERGNAWLQAALGETVVILGTRSAVFTPLPNLGLIVVDEEHDQSYKQQEGFRYHARDLAVMRASRQQVGIVLGSATPSLESMYNVQAGNYQLLRLSDRPGGASLPRIGLLDLKQQSINDGLTPPLIAAIKDRLEKGEQSLLFLNRRGYAPVIMCHSCGWTQSCPRCDAHMIMHRRKNQSRCHHCGSEAPLPEKCPSCDAAGLKPIGEGTERVEDSLIRLFPAARIDRIDRDSTSRKGSLEKKLKAINDGEVDIVIGTQMLSKGHDFPMITLVGVLNADQGLYGADYRGPEYLLQQVLQVSGRAGRADRSGEVLVQTYHPEHPVFSALVAHNYGRFVESALLERKQVNFPPYAYFVMMRAEATEPGRAIHFLTAMRAAAMPLMTEGNVLQLMDPVAAPMEKRAGRYRAQLLLSSDSRAPLHRLLSMWLPVIEASPEARKVRWSVDVDPMDMY